MKNLILFSVLILTVACSNNNDTDENFTPIAITPILIGKGELSGNENIQPQNVVYYNNASWNTMLNSLQQGTSSQFTETTGVDFNNFQLIAVFDIVYTSPISTVTITSVVENQNNIVVKVQKIILPSFFNTVAQSFHIVKIPKSPKPVVFQQAN